MEKDHYTRELSLRTGWLWRLRWWLRNRANRFDINAHDEEQYREAVYGGTP